MINVSELITDPDFAQSFVLLRKSGTWVDGLFETTTQSLNRYGIIEPLTSKEITQLPGGDAITGGIKVWTLEPLYTTRLDADGQNGGISDEVVWSCTEWKILQTQQFSDFGYWQALCVRKRGA